MFTLILYAVLVLCANAQQCLKDVQKVVVMEEGMTSNKGFHDFGIIDDDIPMAPKYDLIVSLGSQKLPIGLIFSPALTFGVKPIIACEEVEKGQNYTVMMLDVDWPSSKNKSQGAYINAIIVNSPSDNLNKGDIVVAYTPTVPKLNSGLHRYVGLLYKQSRYIDADATELLHLARKKEGFSAKQFADQYGLDDPLAGSLFFAEITEC
ncbi:26 kDa secreted antigen-like [Pieris rapae]|uniref:26 kDa secreted antigen-like n=1 Tax=Pieris rapae TaxID=64459 RepID=UPI000B926C4D|nr:26 kDa secreted antigen-like [Pieris rapae]XP_022124143.1 26 kDa secreted antigen-like [Pieris rapae]